MSTPPPSTTSSPARTLSKEDGPLVWIDCEMTGLELGKDRIIEIAVIITDGDLVQVDEGIEFVVQTEKEVLDQMGEWCTDMHGKTGLTQQCIDSPYTLKHVTSEVAKYIRERVPEKGAGILAGSSVHADLGFLRIEMKEVVDWLHYRIVDVSSVKELTSRWYPNLTASLSEHRKTLKPSGSSHRALDDIQESIKELKLYRANVFRDPKEVEQQGVREDGEGAKRVREE